MALQQPDFHSVRTKLQEVGNEIALCVNLPAVDGGQQVLGLLREMREEMRGLRADVAQLREDMQQHELYRDANALARFLNTRAVKSNDALTPFRVLETNQEIEGFPQTVSEMDTLTLQEPVDGDVTQRRRRLKLFTDQLAAAIRGFIWPKVLWDSLTKSLDILTAPVPILQLLNLLCAVASLGLEWPLRPLAGTYLHNSVQVHISLSLLSLFPAIFLYQDTNAALYYSTLWVPLFFAWGYYDGEKSIDPVPWAKPPQPEAGRQMH
ncbi:hypothetical protein CIB48_g8214 [Xylaria polymorpha]|nr:hypothetical protein CIB48_g8214 [Xylaria polymorpha]